MPRALHRLWAERDVLSAFVSRVGRARYRQTILGVGWVVVQTLAAAAVAAVLLHRITNVGSSGQTYFASTVGGLVAWTYIARAVSSGADALIAERSLMRGAWFPREIPPLAFVIVALVDLLVGLAIFLLVALVTGSTPSVHWLALPLVPLVLFNVAAALSLGPAAANVYFRDIGHLIPYVLQFGIILTPVIYPLSLVPASIRNTYAIVNPVAGAIDALRTVVLDGGWPHWAVLLPATLVSGLLLAGSYAVLKRLEPGMDDRL